MNYGFTLVVLWRFKISVSKLARSSIDKVKFSSTSFGIMTAAMKVIGFTTKDTE